MRLEINSLFRDEKIANRLTINEVTVGDAVSGDGVAPIGLQAVCKHIVNSGRLMRHQNEVKPN